MSEIRDMILDVIAKHNTYFDKLNGDLLSRELIKASGLLTSYGQEVAKLEWIFNIKTAELRRTEDTTADANIQAKASQEFLEFKQAKNLREDLLEHMQALKKRIEVLKDEQQNAKY